MRRRTFIVLATSAAVATPLGARAQQPARIPRVGVVVSGLPSAFASRVEALRQGLHNLGYLEGRNIVFEYRYAEGKMDRLPDLFAELVQLKVDVIVTHGTPGPLAAKQATSTIPIVMGNVADPVAAGIVTSLARPGGNITGLSAHAPEITAKGLELLREAFPGATRIAVLSNPVNPAHGPMLKETEAAARVLGMDLQIVQAREPRDLDGAFSAIATKRADALIVFDDQLFVSTQTRIAKLAADGRLPTIFSQPENVEAGGLMSYGVRLADLWRRAAAYVDKILKGAKPADLPVEQPTKFELVINLKTAKALGLAIPPALLLRADQVIE